MLSRSPELLVDASAVRQVPSLDGWLCSLRRVVFCFTQLSFLSGHTMAKQVYYNSKKKDHLKWLPALHLLEVALKLCRTTAVEEHEVEAEILFQKGTMYVGLGLPYIVWFFFFPSAKNRLLANLVMDSKNIDITEILVRTGTLWLLPIHLCKRTPVVWRLQRNKSQRCLVSVIITSASPHTKFYVWLKSAVGRVPRLAQCLSSGCWSQLLTDTVPGPQQGCRTDWFLLLMWEM